MGPLEGLKVIEIAGIGPGPFCAMLLGDLGADVVRIDRTEHSGLGIKIDRKYELLNRSKRSVAVDLKSADGVALVLDLVAAADVLIEGFRPGVAERLGIGPDDCFARNPGLVYGRMTGFGQEGPMAKAAGHDINYIALTGALHAIGEAGEKPVPPLNLVGDFGGGGIYLAFGIMAAIFERVSSGKGQVVDAAMVDGAASLMTAIYGLRAAGVWRNERGTNIIDGGAHFYGTYETKDGRYVSIGSIEPKFYAELLELTGLDSEDLPAQSDRDHWPDLTERLAMVFKQKTRDEWCEIMEGSDVCFAPILSMDEAPDHAHNKIRRAFVEVEGVTQPGPSPRFSRSAAAAPSSPPTPGEHTDEVLADWGVGTDRADELRAQGAVI
jgi:alpha-methylacyl-CoA racemase